MPEFELITTVPKGFLPMPPQRVGAGTYEKTSSTKQTLSVFATVGGLAVQIENVRSVSGGSLDFRVTHTVPSRPGSRFVHNETIVRAGRKDYVSRHQPCQLAGPSHLLPL